jgi:HK97 family phage major capsid protein
MINTIELSGLLQEASTLSNKANWTKQDERRNAWLLSAISAVKAGASLQDVNQQYVNDVEERNGLPITQFAKSSLTSEQRAQAQLFRHFVKGERRDIEGSPMLSHIGTYSGLGYFVPTGFFQGVFETLKAYDFLFNEDDVTLVRTSNGRAMTVPTMSDTEHDASVIAEAGSRTEVDIADPNQATLGVYSYASRRWTVSLEAFEDLEGSLSAMNLFQKFTAKALARGIGRDLVTGNGINKTLGLIPALSAAGVVPVVASGSSVNTGGVETGASSIGSVDLELALAALNPAYIGPKTAWGMNWSTLNTLRGLVNKFGSPLDIVRDTVDGPAIYGVPVKIAPSLDNIGPSNNPIVLGDFEYWATRLVTADDAMGIKSFRESVGLIENGLIGFRSFVRAGGSLLWSDVNSPAPFVVLANHS